MQVLLTDLEEALKQLRVKTPFNLIGYSLGGAVAAEYAKRHPYRVHRLVLVATPTRFRLTPLTALALRLPRWLKPVASGWLSANPDFLRQFHNPVLKYWHGTSAYKDLYAPTLRIRTSSMKYYEPDRTPGKWTNVQEELVRGDVFAGNRLNKLIGDFISK
jgi:pimeloyl-ACP methyl ester carboxylesterase